MILAIGVHVIKKIYQRKGTSASKNFDESLHYLWMSPLFSYGAYVVADLSVEGWKGHWNKTRAREEFRNCVWSKRVGNLAPTLL